jgi:hypothetical protein
MKLFAIHDRLLGIVLGCVVLLSAGSTSSAVADEKQSQALEQTSSKMVALFCANEGKLARCAGQIANDCQQIVKPFVDSCLSQVQQGAIQPDGDLFERCFWAAFSKKYGKSFDYSDDCFYSDNKDNNPLQAAPPELEKDMRPLNK